MKADEGRTLTDAELEKLEEQIIEAYGDAAGEMQAIIDEYFEKFAALDEEYKALIGQTVNGEEWTEERYQQWRLAQLGRGERFNLMRDRLNERVTAANETAMAYINDATPGIYTLNRNYAAYEVGGTGDFTLLDEQTVRRLVAEQPDLMPYYPEEKAVRRGIDLEYGKKQITNSVTRGILTGRSSHEIAADLLTRVQDMSVTSAIRAARTAVTAAENGGRQASYEKAAAMGIEMEREWMATKDARTRPEHGAADGQRVAVDEPFIVGGQRLMTPGDTSHGASGWNIYNCRCCVRAVVKGHGRKRETYAEWLEKRKAEDPEGTALEFIKTAYRSADYTQWQEYRKIVKGAVPNSFAEFQDLKYNKPEQWEYVKDLRKYLTKYPNSSKTYFDIQQELRNADIKAAKKGIILPAKQEHAYILPSGKHDPYHIMHRMMKRNITDDDLRNYMQGAKVMIVQWGGQRRRYISNKGMCVISRENDEWVFKTAWSTVDFDEESDKIVEVIKNAGL